jgi:predicted metal-dependent enzyme (double-stranded beta helix superfamily)
MKNLSLPPSLARLVAMLKSAITSEGKLTPLKAKTLVLEAEVQVEDMMQYADFDHPIEDCYGRKLVYDNGNFEVMVMSWNPGDYSSIHNHGYTQWGVVQVFGNTHHMIYQVKNNKMSFAKKELLMAGTAIKVNNGLIHQMGNATSDRYLTLHVYGANDRDEAITADAKNYDLELDRVAHTCGGAFFNLPADNVHDVEPGVEPTREVFMHYTYLLMSYYNRQPQTKAIKAKKQHLMTKIEPFVFQSANAEPAL